MRHRPGTRRARDDGSRTARGTDATAPEHPYPAALEDVIAVYRELLTTVGADDLAVAGESAGGGLLLMLLQSARAQGLPMPAGAVPRLRVPANSSWPR